MTRIAMASSLFCESTLRWSGERLLLEVGALDLILDRRDGANVGNYGVEVFGRHVLVERVWHRRREVPAGWCQPIRNCLFDIGVAPIANARVLVRRDIGRAHVHTRG